MGVISSIGLSSSQQRSDEVIEVGIGESISVTAAISGTDISTEYITFDLKNDQDEVEMVITGIGDNYLEFASEMTPNAYRNKWVILDKDATLREVRRVRSNTSTRINFQPGVVLSGLTSIGKTMVITNIIATINAAITPNTGSTEEGTSSVVFSFQYGQSLITSRIAGYYLIKAFWRGYESADPPGVKYMQTDVVLMSVNQIKNGYMAGIPAKVINPLWPAELPKYIDVFPNDDQIRKAIFSAISSFEANTGVFLYPRKVVSNPGPDDVYDIEIAGVDYRGPEPYFSLQLPHAYIIDIDRIEGYYGNQLLITWNKDWFIDTTKKRIGLVQFVPRMGGVGYADASFIQGDFVMRQSVGDYLPSFFKVDYTCGWNELQSPIPDVFLDIIGKDTVCNIADIWGDALNPGIANKSISFDGLSTSLGTTASAIYGLFSAKRETYKKDIKEKMAEIKTNGLVPAVAVVI